ncbi:hypothetical protein KKC59_04075, partial [bacterium]|nr:hypothetical protein [bacterium]
MKFEDAAKKIDNDVIGNKLDKLTGEKAKNLIEAYKAIKGSIDSTLRNLRTIRENLHEYEIVMDIWTDLDREFIKINNKESSDILGFVTVSNDGSSVTVDMKLGLTEPKDCRDKIENGKYTFNINADIFQKKVKEIDNSFANFKQLWEKYNNLRKDAVINPTLEKQNQLKKIRLLIRNVIIEHLEQISLEYRSVLGGFEETVPYGYLQDLTLLYYSKLENANKESVYDLIKDYKSELDKKDQNADKIKKLEDKIKTVCGSLTIEKNDPILKDGRENELYALTSVNDRVKRFKVLIESKEKDSKHTDLVKKHVDAYISAVDSVITEKYDSNVNPKLRGITDEDREVLTKDASEIKKYLDKRYSEFKDWRKEQYLKRRAMFKLLYHFNNNEEKKGMQASFADELARWAMQIEQYDPKDNNHDRALSKKDEKQSKWAEKGDAKSDEEWLKKRFEDAKEQGEIFAKDYEIVEKISKNYGKDNLYGHKFSSGNQMLYELINKKLKPKFRINQIPGIVLKLALVGIGVLVIVMIANTVIGAIEGFFLTAITTAGGLFLTATATGVAFSLPATIGFCVLGAALIFFAILLVVNKIRNKKNANFERPIAQKVTLPIVNKEIPIINPGEYVLPLILTGIGITSILMPFVFMYFLPVFLTTSPGLWIIIPLLISFIAVHAGIYLAKRGHFKWGLTIGILACIVLLPLNIMALKIGLILIVSTALGRVGADYLLNEGTEKKYLGLALLLAGAGVVFSSMFLLAPLVSPSIYIVLVVTELLVYALIISRLIYNFAKPKAWVSFSEKQIDKDIKDIKKILDANRYDFGAEAVFPMPIFQKLMTEGDCKDKIRI